MDSPIQKNFIYKYCFEKEKMEKIFALENSVFNLTKVNDLYFLSTVY